MADKFLIFGLLISILGERIKSFRVKSFKIARKEILYFCKINKILSPHKDFHYRNRNTSVKLLFYYNIT